ncbi:MAG: glycosyltransferase family 2 protein [Sphingobacteriales bacterium]|nr:MAG: glycosyltransferase family 2 protein [Sphingobacteriales bacterium]
MPLITVFTPTYNRAALLPRLYESLGRQTFADFEWIIVDDGSADNTRDLVRQFTTAGFAIRYYYQENAGKHFAINRGVNEAAGELFFILDSDDMIPEEALATVAQKYDTLNDKLHIGGVAGRKAYFDGNLIGSGTGVDEEIMNVFDFRYKRKIAGDMCEVFKTSVLKEFPFPEIKGERFCPEALVWNRIGTKYPLLWFNAPIYLAEYQPEGLTARIFEVRKNSPVATTICYQELSRAPISMAFRFRALINYWRFAFYLEKSFAEKLKAVHPILSLFALPIAGLMYLNDKRK